MRHVAVSRSSNTQVARPLKVLVPLIKDELVAGNEAGLEHYRHAGDLLNEARDSGQVPPGSWSRWLTTNFALSQSTARNYMRLARDHAGKPIGAYQSLEDALGHQPRRERHARLKPLHDAMDRVKVDRLANERQTRDDEIKLHRELALQLIDLGYRALATRLHPDRGGSRDAMGRLNAVRDELKEIAATRRFV
jgi:hypothetical protein